MPGLRERSATALWRLIDSLRPRMILLFAIILVPPTILSLALWINTYRQQSDMARGEVRRLAELASGYEADFFADVQRTLQSLPPAVHGLSSADCSTRLGAMLAAFPEFTNIFLFDHAGTVYCASASTAIGMGFSDRPWFRQITTKPAFVVGEFAAGPASKVPVVMAAEPLAGAGTAAFAGAIAVGVKLDRLGLIGRGAGFPHQGVIYLFDPSGTLLSSSVSPPASDDAGLPPSSALRAMKQGSIDEFDAVGRDGVSRVYSSVVLGNTHLVQLFGLPAADTIDWIKHDLVYRIGVLALIWVAVILAAWF